MTPKDRQKIAQMLRERLPDGWKVIASRWGLTACGPDSRTISIHNDRAWVDWDKIVEGEDGWHDHNRPRAIGQGWRTRLVDDVVAAASREQLTALPPAQATPTARPSE